MEKIYRYNLGTNVLHIRGYCHYIYEAKDFDSEEAVFAFAGHSVRFCKVCAKKRDKLLKQQNQE